MLHCSVEPDATEEQSVTPTEEQSVTTAEEDAVRSVIITFITCLILIVAYIRKTLSLKFRARLVKSKGNYLIN